MKALGKIVIGLTGTILSGKSAALKEFARLGCHTEDVDALAARVRAEPQTQRKIKTLLGVSGPKEIAAVIFKNSAKKKAFEALMHPLMIAAAAREFKDKKGILVLEASLLFEADTQAAYDITVNISAKESTVLKRAAARGMPEKEAAARLRTQMPDEERNLLADVVIDNNGSVTQLNKQIKELVNNIRKI